MKADQALYETIEQYLADSLPEPARQAFELRLKADPGLEEELELHRLMQESAADPVKLALRRRLAGLSKEHALDASRRHKFLLWSAAVLIVAAGIAITLLLSRPDAPPPVAPPLPVQPEVPQPPAPSPSTSPKAEPVPKDIPSSSGPIASVDPKDFEPNSVLDPLVDVQFRGEMAFEFNLDMPVNKHTLARRKDKATLRIKGAVLPADNIQIPLFNVQLFNNKPEDFFQDRPIYSRELPLLPSGDTWVFDISPTLHLKPGLYYLVIALEDGEPVAVRRVEVR